MGNKESKVNWALSLTRYAILRVRHFQAWLSASFRISKECWTVISKDLCQFSRSDAEPALCLPNTVPVTGDPLGSEAALASALVELPFR